MARIQIRTAGGIEVRPLATSTLLGRHQACTWPVAEARVPLYWLELRWSGGHWAWRVLVGEDDTRGPGRVQPGGWRRIAEGERIVGPADAEIRLEEGGAPAPFARDVESGEVLDDESLDAVIEPRGDGNWPVGAEDDPRRTAPLRDGELFRSGNRILRFHDGQAPNQTVRPPVTLRSPGCTLAVHSDDGAWVLEVMERDELVTVSAEYVRVLVPYVEVRRADIPPGGWLELDAAHFRWQQIGGSAESGRDRIAQDRSRLCRALGASGVGAASSLFETRRGPEGWVTRVRLPAEQLSID